MQNPALNFLAGGWGLNVINTMTSGLPLNITYSGTTQASLSTLTTPRPSLTGAPLYLTGGNPQYYLNAAAFSVPSYAQPWGTSPRNPVRLPAFYELDFGLHKKFPLGTEGRYLQFRAEAFNIQNKTNFAPPGTSANSSGFGVFSSTFAPRQIQLALKLIF